MIRLMIECRMFQCKNQLKNKIMGMIKRKDGSYSKRGLWDNIRANKGSGKKPTAEMLKQEKKIKNENKMGGMKKMYGGTKKKMMQKGGAKPDFLDMDKDGNKTESMKSAVASKKKMAKGGVKTTKKVTKPALKKVKKMMGGSKKMYEQGGFLDAPSSVDLDKLGLS